MNPFKKFLSKLGLSAGSILPESANDVVGIDIGTSSIKLVEIKKKSGRAMLETYSTLALGPYAQKEIGAVTNLSLEDLGKALGDAMREGSITTTNAAFSIPSSASLVFVIELPAGIAEKDLPSVVPTEARKYIPVPITEVSLDYWPIPNRDNSTGKTEVLCAAIHNDTITRYREIASAAGLSVDVFEIEIFSAIRSSFAHELSAVLLMDFGASKTKLAIVEYGVVRTFHIVNRGSADITTNISTSLGVPFAKAEDLKRSAGLTGVGETKAASDIAKIAAEYILSETSSTISNFERRYQKPVSKIILTGAGSLMPGFREFVADTLRIETAASEPFNKVTIPEFVTRILKETGPEFATSLGLALRKLS